MSDQYRYIDAFSLNPSRACSYKIPESWVLYGRSGGGAGSGIEVLTELEKQRKLQARMMARYWSAVGYLWFRTRKLRSTTKEGKRINHRQSFLTLTVPGQAIGDHKALKNQCLDKFWTWCRNVHGLEHYVWTAELQKRGEIHFHAILNSTLPYEDLNRAWNRICDHSGIIEMSKGSLKSSSRIEICRSARGSKAYAAKYLSKSMRSGGIGGRVWSGSHSVTGLGSISTNAADMDYDYERVAKELQNRGHTWIDLDHGVSTTQLDSFAIDRKTYPYIHRLFKRYLYENDRPTTGAVHHTDQLVDQSTITTATRLGSNSQVSHHSADRSLLGNGDSVICEQQQLLQVSRSRIIQGAFWPESAYV